MVGLEQLEIHSKSYIVRWIRVEEGHSISWSIQPHKKSINFGIFKHPGKIGDEIPSLSTTEDGSTSLVSLESEVTHTDRARRALSSRKNTSTAQEQLKAKGFTIIQWNGKCEADKVSMGTHSVLPGNGGMYGLILDNTFSKQVSKTATLVMLTYPTNVPPKNAYYNLNSIVSGSLHRNPGVERQFSLSTLEPHTVDNLSKNKSASMASDNPSKENPILGGFEGTEDPMSHVGVLSKRRRKKRQGFANRFFSLDFATCTLSYYYNRSSSALRGAIPLSLAAITADKRGREIIIDAGAEIWHLRADNIKDFVEWTTALEQASKIARGISTTPTNFHNSRARAQIPHSSSFNASEEEREWEQVEALVSRIVGTRDAIDRLSKKTALCEPRQNVTLGPEVSLPNHSISGEDNDYFNHLMVPEKKTFWKRKFSHNSSSQNTIRTQLKSSSAMTSSTNVTATCSSVSLLDKGISSLLHAEINMHEHCSALLSDLNSVLGDFSVLIAKNKQRRAISKPSLQRSSFESHSTNSTAEFFDAESGYLDRPKVYRFSDKSEDYLQLSDPDEGSARFTTDKSSISSDSNENLNHLNGVAAIFPSRPKTLDPLPVKLLTKRRNVILPATVLPPSLISFLRKNIGKDLSTISMPVSANEPTSLLQRLAEQLEYAQLLDKAAHQMLPENRLCYVAAFAVSNFSINRCKVRALRKPFNPMLGETFELLRADDEVPGGFRFIAEKVSHRPVCIASQADSKNWSLSQSPSPTNKFWGKSAEIITEGRVRLVLHLEDGSDELYSWTVASAFLRNVVMGEKYIEPVGSTTLVNESTGAKAIIEFKHKGMFGGRIEDVEIRIDGPDNEYTGKSVVGTWTSSLRMTEDGNSSDVEIWRVGDLVENSAKRYGLTTFAVSLNEITQFERGRIPITDSRLRPDQRAAENGNLDDAERIKAILEEKQRIRRKIMEENGEVWKPRWFTYIEGGDDGEKVWKLKSGKNGYWEQRSQGVWTEVQDVLSI